MVMDQRMDATPPARASAGRVSSRILIVAGVGVALALGIGAGFLFRPDLGEDPAARPPSGQMAVELNAPVLTPPPQTAGRLEVLPPDMAKSTAPASPAARFALPPLPPLPPATSAGPNTSLRPVRSAPVVAALMESPALPPQPLARAGFNCANPQGEAETVVCSDPELMADDRELAHAYRRALRSGAPPADIRDDQRDWLDIREQAARRSPQAVASVYRQRIDELNAIADSQ